MSLGVCRPVAPELELVESTERSVQAFHHGFPCDLVRWHYHDEYELHLIVASSGKVFVGDHVGAFAPGQLVLTGPRLPHNWISHVVPGESIALRDYVVQFREDLVRAMATAAPELRVLMPLLERARHGVEFRGTVRGEAETWFRRIIDSQGPARIARLVEFLDRLVREPEYRLLSTMPMRSAADAAALNKVELVTQYVSEHHSREIPLATVAKLVGMSDSAFSRFFAKSTGNGFGRFLNRVRVAKACELLAGTATPITDICFDVGFNNVANFNRRFRELKSVTPREYRRQSASLLSNAIVPEGSSIGEQGRG